MEQIFFVLSATLSLLFAVKMISIIVGNVANIPLPFFHLFKISASNVYISFSAVSYQIYFWSTPLFS